MGTPLQFEQVSLENSPLALWGLQSFVVSLYRRRAAGSSYV